nr:hypothetical protein [Tanacetum cinerariifolium]
MSYAFANTQNMVAILTKSKASEGFDQIIDLLNGSYIKLQALVDRKKIVIMKAVIRDALRLSDAESMSTKRTLWNEFSSAMASAVICLSTGRKFNFLKYIFDSLVRNVNNKSKFYMYPRLTQLIIQNQLGDLSTHTTKYISPALTQKVFANIRRVGKGCSGVETPFFVGMLVAGEPEEQDDEDEQAQGNDNDAAQEDDIAITGGDVQDQSIPSPNPPTLPPQPPQDIPSTSQVGTSQRVDTSDDTIMKDVSNQGRMIDELDIDEGVELMDEKEEEKAKEVKVIAGDAQVEGSMKEDELEVQEVMEVVTTTKLITEVVTVASTPVSAASIIIPAVEPKVPAATITAAPVKDVAIDHVKQKAKEDPYVQRLDYFKGMSYDDIRPIFEAKFNSNIKFLLKSKEQIEEEENRATESINETSAQKIAKRRKMNEDVKDLK